MAELFAVVIAVVSVVGVIRVVREISEGLNDSGWGPTKTRPIEFVRPKGPTGLECESTDGSTIRCWPTWGTR